MTELRPELPEPPVGLASLPIDERGYPVPWFVETVDGKPDHRIIDGEKIAKAWINSLCWVCGAPLGGPQVTYVIGPMCAVNRISAEPPSHYNCGLYSVMACPFMSRPHAKRRESGLPENYQEAAGVMIKRNPGVTLLWTAKRMTTYAFEPPGGGLLFNIGTPAHTEWYCEGREATREEIEASIDTGLPALQEIAEKQGRGAPEALAEKVVIAKELLPA